MEREYVIKLIKKYKHETSYKKNINKIGIFGSVAKNEFTDSGDIDIFVELKKPKMFDLIGIKQDLETLLHKHVDIIMLRNRMNQFLKEHIEQEGIYVW